MAGIEPASEEFVAKLLQACSVFESCTSGLDRQRWKCRAVLACAAWAIVIGTPIAAPQLGVAQHWSFGGELVWTSLY